MEYVIDERKLNLQGPDGMQIVNILRDIVKIINSGGATTTVDNALSATSENPVQNKVVTSALSAKLNLNQGAESAGKFMVVGSDGVVVPVTMQTWQGGNY